MYDHIVIPVDGSDEAEHAARRGLELASAFDSTVDVLYVVEQNIRRLAKTDDEEARLREAGETTLAAIETLAAELDHPVTTKLVTGKPAVQISKYAAERDTDLVVIGRQGTTGLGKRLLGSVTENVLHRGDVPVFVVPGGDSVGETTADYSRVLIPTDGSGNGETVTPHGVAFATNLDSTLHVLNVVDLQAAGGLFNAGGLETEFVERLEAEGQEAVDRIAAEIAKTQSDVDVQTAVERTTSFGGPAVGIQEYVEEHDIGLVAMSSHGRSNLKRQLVGSVASAVLRTVDVPVLIVKRTS
ncbi:universal stress protein [Halobacterium zhouii]|uniref:universal stress protein n=1 Tax=Halobacterium zhouii TaxID=2902624 RepID=UPI001E2B26DF|nr:universal stress protein [Halobacterium zhouii]